MSKLEMLRVLVKQRLDATAADMFELFARTIADYEEELCRLKENEQQHKQLDAVFNLEVQLHGSDVQQLLVNKEGPPPERSPSLDQEDPEPLHLKERQKEPWISLEGEQLKGLKEGYKFRFPFTAVPVKSEDDDEEPQSSQLHQSQKGNNREAEPPACSSATQIKTETDGEDCGGSEPARNLVPDIHSPPNTDDEQASESSKNEVNYDYWQEPLSVSEPETEDSDNGWKGTRAPESAGHALKYMEASVSDKGCNTGKRSSRCLVFKKCSRVKQKIDSQIRVHTAERTNLCDICGKIFTNQYNMKLHMIIHTGEKLFSCDACGKRFTWQKSLKRHTRVHTGEKLFSCDACGKRFARVDCLKQHVQVHTGEKLFSCGVCGRRFAQQNCLKRHMRVHTGEKPSGCDLCGRRFARVDCLKEHMRVHTGEKLFGCDVCGRSFTWSRGLKQHMRVHTREKLLGCDVCGRRFARQNCLKRHMKTHTG